MFEAGLRFPLFRAMPNLLVGIGLLLTFLGLVSALYFTTDAIKNAADLTASQNALRDLLGAASFKFYTSIAGLGGSIMLTLVLRYGTSKVEARFDDLAFALEQKIVLVTSEWIAFEHLREAKEQTRNLKQFNTEVAISVGKRLEEALSAHLPTYLAQAMAPISKSLEEVATKITAMNEGAIGELAGKFAGKLEGTTGVHIQALADTLSELRTSLADINQRLSESGGGLARHIADSSQDLRAALEAIGIAAGALKEAAGPLTETSRLIADASQRMVTATQAAQEIISGARAEIHEVAEALRASLESTARQWESYEKRFKDVDESLGVVLERIVASVQANLEGLRSFVEKIDEKLAGAIDKLGGGIDDLGEFAQRMEQVTSRLNGGGPHVTP
jgi:prophage DNA circulation protein